MVFVSGLPPFNPDTGEVLAGAPIELRPNAFSSR
jgi:enamine deaminase RidA (YjgF/YER057c/UK114 family)